MKSGWGTGLVYTGLGPGGTFNIWLNFFEWDNNYKNWWPSYVWQRVGHNTNSWHNFTLFVRAEGVTCDIVITRSWPDDFVQEPQSGAGSPSGDSDPWTTHQNGLSCNIRHEVKTRATFIALIKSSVVWGLGISCLNNRGEEKLALLELRFQYTPPDARGAN